MSVVAPLRFEIPVPLTLREYEKLELVQRTFLLKDLPDAFRYLLQKEKINPEDGIALGAHIHAVDRDGRCFCGWKVTDG